MRNRRNLVLIIDDDIKMQELMKLELEMAGYCVSTASGGCEALSKLNIVKPDLILLEAMMPHEDGYSLCRRMKELYTIPILIIVDGEDDEGIRAFEAGATDYMTKPFSHIELTTRVKTALCRSLPAESFQTEDLCSNRVFPVGHLTGAYNLSEGSCYAGFSRTSPGNDAPWGSSIN